MLKVKLFAVVLGLVFMVGVQVPWWGYSCMLMMVSFVVVLGVPFFSSALSVFSMIDVLSWVMIVLTFLICSLSVLASSKVYLSGLFGRVYTFLMLSIVLSLVMAFSSPSIISLYWWFEVSLVPLICLIIGWGYQPERLMAVKYMVVYTMAGSLPFLGLVLLMFSQSGSWALWGSFNIFGWWWVLLAPFLVKMPLYGVHSWLPKAHVEAPVAGSMILAGLTLKLGGYGMMRMISVFKGAMGPVEFFLCMLAVWSTIVTPMVCISQVDMKSLIAYSSVSHMGLVICGIFSMSSWGWSGAIMLMVGHAFASSGLFCLVGLIYSWSGTRNLSLCKGVLSMNIGLFFLGFLLLGISMGMPFSVNLCGEILLVGSVIQFGSFLVVVMTLMSVLTVGYSLYFFGCLFHGQVSECMISYDKEMLGMFLLTAHVACAFLSVFLCDFFFVCGL